MEINIKVSENNAVPAIATIASDARGAATATAASDGGYSPANNNGSAGSSVSDGFNIGGPPQWLTDAIGTKNNHQPGGSTGAVSSAGDMADAGAAPFFE